MRVHKRHVVADEQRAAAFGNVLASFDAYAIDRMCCHPQHEAQQRIRQQIDRVRGGDKRQDRAVEKNTGRRLMENIRENVVRAGCEPDADERHQIRRGDHAALLLRARPVLDQRAQGNGKYSAEKSE